MHCLKKTLILWTATLVVSCGSGNSDSSNPSTANYVAAINTDMNSTSIQIVKITDNDDKTPTVEVIKTSELDYGAGPFFLNQGVVPDGQKYVSSECYGKSNLTSNDLINCWAKPTLSVVKSIAEEIGLDIETLAVTAQFSWDDNSLPLYDRNGESLETFVQKFDSFTFTNGFNNSQIFEDEAPYSTD